MQTMAHSSSQTAWLLLLVLAATVPAATAQGRSKIRIVEVINGNIDNITMNLVQLHDIVAMTTTTAAPTTPRPTTIPSLNVTDNGTTAIVQEPPLQGEHDGTLVAFGISVPEVIFDETLDCGNNTNCDKLRSALDEVDAIVAEVEGDDINEGQADRIYQADADVVEVYIDAKEDTELYVILHDNIDYLDTRMETVQEGKAVIQDRYEKMKSTETVAMVLGLIAILVAFIGLTAAGFACYQKTRKDPGVPEGLIYE